MRRMMVVLYEEKPVKSASFAPHARPERKFAASLAEQQGFEPAVAIRFSEATLGMELSAVPDLRNAMIRRGLEKVGKGSVHALPT